MLGEIEYKDLLVKTPYEKVWAIVGGDKIHNSSLVLVSEKFASLINQLRKDFDYVLIDSAPVLQSSDYIHVLQVTDGVLFLVRHAKTTKTQVEDAVKELKKNGANILGSVFTMHNGKNK
jgi:receptor protein-tyrosine kinase